MGRFKLDANGVQKIKKMLERQVNKVNTKLACNAYTFLTEFEYKKDGGGPFRGGGGWNHYYVANWNVSVNGIDESVTPQVRDREYVYYTFAKNKAEKNTKSCVFGDTISVTNSVYYGKTLNDGGQFDETQDKGAIVPGIERRTWAEPFSMPNRFIELCTDYLNNISVQVINQTLKECKSI